MNNFHDIKLSVPKRSEPIRLDMFLAAQTSFSRRRIRRAIDEGGVYVNRKRNRKAGIILKGNEKIHFVLLEQETLVPFEAEQLVWQKDHLYLLHKRFNQYSQEALHRSKGTLPDELATHLGLYPDQAKNLRPVHRLDRGTSGLMLMSGKPTQLQQLQSMWHSHVQKSYLAVVSPAPEWNTKRITFAIGKDRDNRGRYAVCEDGRACDTEGEVLQRQDNRALLKLTPHTGRTHQLRVHLSHLECPIVGDSRYGGSSHHRLMLHAHSLCIQAPALKKTRRWVVEPEEDWTW
ncbi:MAG: RluA family pseudouridine synthase [Mariprofundaceae bacterium]